MDEVIAKDMHGEDLRIGDYVCSQFNPRELLQIEGKTKNINKIRVRPIHNAKRSIALAAFMIKIEPEDLI